MKLKIRQNQNKAKRKIRTSARDIGNIPQVQDVINRIRCDQSLLYFLTHVFPQKFDKPFGSAHLQYINALQNIIQNGGLQAIGCSRASGKSTIAHMAVLWAAITGRRSYSLFVALSAKLAKDANQSIYVSLRSHDKLLSLYPAACYPIRCLQGSNGRARSQLYKGRPTGLQFGKKIVFAAVGDVSDNCVININSIQAGIRGQAATRNDGTRIRPSLIIVDDIVNDKTASSPAVQQNLQKTLQNSIAFLAGPGVKISIALIGTIVSKFDIMNKYLDRKQKPHWKGIKMPALYSMPNDMKLWQEYKQIYTQDVIEGKKDDINRQSNLFYLKNRQKMDEGAKSSWDGRLDDNDISSIQHAMKKWAQNQDSFFSQYQLQPVEQLKNDNRIKVQDIQGKYSGLKRCERPSQQHTIQIGIDCNMPALSWVVTASTKDFKYIIDYGFTPQSPQRYFKMEDHRNPLSRRFPAAKLQDSIKLGLDYILNELNNKYQPNVVLIDRGYDQSIDPVSQMCKKYQSITKNIYLPAKGHAFPKTSLSTYADSKKKQGQTIDKGGMWKITSNINGVFIQHQTNMNKNDLSQLFKNNRIFLYQQNEIGANHHRLFIQHCISQYPTVVQAAGGYKTIWSKDNRFKGEDHLFDALLLANLGNSLIKHNKIKSYKKQQVKEKPNGPFTFTY